MAYVKLISAGLAVVFLTSLSSPRSGEHVETGRGRTNDIRILDRQTVDYREEHDSRVIAEVRITLKRSPEHSSLQIATAAVGPYVDPPPGYHGVRGYNSVTASELQHVYKSNLAQVRTRNLSTDEVIDGTVRQGRRAALQRRELSLGGTIAVKAPVAEELVELVFDSGSLSDGWYRTDIHVANRSRLWVLFFMEGDVGSIVKVGQ